MAPPISYMLDGRQYITVLSGMATSLAAYGTPANKYNTDYRHQARRVLTFVLDGTGQLPPRAPFEMHPVDDPNYASDDDQIKRGATVYRRCASCHGVAAIAGGNAPDLRMTGIPVSADAFAAIVQGGASANAGMPKFDDLSDQQISDVREYLRAQAARWRAADSAVRK